MRLAHLSDFHLLAPADPPDWRLRCLAAWRPVDRDGRYERAVRALRVAAGADVIVITGDLTETGSAGQFGVFADALVEAGVDPDQVVLLPGNHDRYGVRDGWELALAGPLSAFGHAARSGRGVFLERGGLRLTAIDVTRWQGFVRSTGFFTDAERRHLAASLGRVDGEGRHAIVALHHAPERHPVPPWHWVNGLDGTGALYEVLGSRPRSLLHGHVHRDRQDRWGPHQIHAVPAVLIPSKEPPVVFHDVAPDGEIRRITPRPAPTVETVTQA